MRYQDALLNVPGVTRAEFIAASIASELTRCQVYSSDIFYMYDKVRVVLAGFKEFGGDA